MEKWTNKYKCDIIIVHGVDLVSTGTLEHRWQAGAFTTRAQKINANKVKNAFANMFGGNQAVAFA